METPKKVLRSSGNSTIAYLREKSEKEQSMREEELKLKQKEVELNMQRQEAYERQTRQIVEQSQQQTQALMFLINKLAEKI